MELVSRFQGVSLYIYGYRLAQQRPMGGGALARLPAQLSLPDRALPLARRAAARRFA